MTNLEFLRTATKAEIAEWLEHFDPMDIYEDIGKDFCKHCDAIVNDGKEYSWCELHENVCKFFPDGNEVEWWLDMEHRENGKEIKK